MKLPMHIQMLQSEIDDSITRATGLPVVSMIETAACPKSEITWLGENEQKSIEWKVVRCFHLHGIDLFVLGVLQPQGYWDLMLYLKDTPIQVFPNDPSTACTPKPGTDLIACASHMATRFAARVPSYEWLHAQIARISEAMGL